MKQRPIAAPYNFKIKEWAGLLGLHYYSMSAGTDSFQQEAMNNSKKNRVQIMQEVLELQAQWEHALMQLTKGRQFDELALSEQEEWKRISVIYNDQIDIQLAEWEQS